MKLRARIECNGTTFFWWRLVNEDDCEIVESVHTFQSHDLALTDLRAVCAALGCEVPEIEEGT